MYALKVSLILAVVLLGVSAHEEDEGPKTIISAGGADATHRFARSCNKRSTSSCVLQAEVTAGPYYYDTQLVRQNITEGYSGIPMVLNISVVDVNSCSPIADAAVDIWHCNAVGIYSHFQVTNNNGGANTTFLRGIQMTDTNGNVSFHTIFPGWYQPRAIHIHVKVHVGGASATTAFSGGSVVHTGQMFVSDTIASNLKSISPYSQNMQSLNTLANDQVYPDAGSIAILDVEYTSLAESVIAYIVLGVDTSASASGSSSSSSTQSSSSTSAATSSSPSTSSTSGSSTVASTTLSSNTNQPPNNLYIHFAFTVLLYCFFCLHGLK